MTTPTEPLAIVYDEGSDVVTIEGVRYSGCVFRTLGIGRIGTALRLVNRDDGVLTVRTLHAFNPDEVFNCRVCGHGPKHEDHGP